MPLVISKREERALSTDELIRRLEAIRAEHTVMSTPFVKDLTAGRVPVDGLKRFAANWYYLTWRTAPPVAAKPYYFRQASEEIFRTAIQNGMGEIGFLADAPHPYLARALCEGLGMTDEEIDRAHILPEMHWYTEFVHTNQGNSGPGTDNPGVRAGIGVIEADAAVSTAALARALKEEYGLDDAAVSYWDVHSYADKKHGEENARMAGEMCRTRKDQDAALQVAENAMRSRNRLWSAFRSLY